MSLGVRTAVPRWILGLCPALALCVAAAATGAELRPFDARSLDAIRASHAGRPFVLAFWSTQCEPCRDEMALWKSVRRKHPGLRVVLVATDPPAERPAIERFLKRYSPGSVENWTFADEFSERVRYAVDPKWRGELPRTYFFDATHQPQSQSGVPDRGWVERWIVQTGKGQR